MRFELCLPAMVTCARHSMVSEHQHHRLIVYCLHHIPVQANGTKIIVIIKFSVYTTIFWAVKLYQWFRVRVG